MVKILTIIAWVIFVPFLIKAQDQPGFASIKELTPIPVTKDTGETPQSKVWTYANTHWAVLPDAEGTHLWRLDGTQWSKQMTLSDIAYKADCKVVGNVTHVLLFRGLDYIYLTSLEYVPSSKSYKTWSKRPTPVELFVGKDALTATIDVDSKGRMWLASDNKSSIDVRWSDAPYANWSEPIVLATGVTNGDICAVVAMAGKVGVIWSNQNTRRFGFKTHKDGKSPTDWSIDEVPSSQSALDIKQGMANASLNLAVAGDGTLFCAIKTNYNLEGYPRLALLVRRSSGKWEDLHEITQSGERPLVILNEDEKKLKVIYNTSSENGNNIVYKESSTAAISFTPEMTLFQGPYTDATSIKGKYTSEVVVLASNSDRTAGVLASDVLPTDDCCKWVIYPNPFFSTTSLYFTLLQNGRYEVSLYDTNGSKVTMLKQGDAIAGEVNKVDIKGEDFARGLYLVKIQTEEKTEVLKLVLDK
ncbi:T9SS type A sorting domain-containing protein [Pontibacter litorisediminis]|uniref:T9SS type A sorting domain-containing protein n=1 Tax=Pontibacter litorisediminis TaxID=1846260 RepID=UPI0023EC7F19|nr:T9SS type A sorting domain-containing protein [Pontibacter litorisediminis]